MHSLYQQQIAAIAPNYVPAQIEAWMRLEHSTLDGLSAAKFRKEVRIACELIDADPAASARLAQSYGL